MLEEPRSESESGRAGTPAVSQDDETATPPSPEETISGTIVLPPLRRTSVKTGDTIFITARRTGGAPGPGSLLAAQRLQADHFPLPFTVSGRDAMIPGVPFQGIVSITVRVDKDGDPLTRQTGDLFGEVGRVAVGAHEVVVRLDRLQTEDVTLGTAGMLDGSQAGGRALPPGHPVIP
jgi:hypothetical protein